MYLIVELNNHLFLYLCLYILMYCQKYGAHKLESVDWICLLEKGVGKHFSGNPYKKSFH